MPEQKATLSQLPPQPAPQEVPTDLVPLPSEGKAYPPAHPLHNKKTIAIRSMTARDEDILTSRALIRSGRVVSALLHSCIMDKSVDPDSMLCGDRNAALIGIRITGYGPEYPITIECPGCSVSIKHTVELDKLPIKKFPEGLEPGGSNAFTVTLPVSKRSCTFKLLDGVEETELMQMVDRGRRAAGMEELVTARLRRQVVELGGERDPQKLSSLIMQMPARDSRWLRQRIDAVEPGVQLKTEFKCPSCGAKGEVEVPLGTDFFWPEA